MGWVGSQIKNFEGLDWVNFGWGWVVSQIKNLFRVAFGYFCVGLVTN